MRSPGCRLRLMVQFVEDGFDGFSHPRGAGVGGAGIFGVDRIEGRGLVLFECCVRPLTVLTLLAGSADADEVHVIALGGGVGRFHCRGDGCGELVGIGGGEVLPPVALAMQLSSLSALVGGALNPTAWTRKSTPRSFLISWATAQGFPQLLCPSLINTMVRSPLAGRSRAAALRRPVWGYRRRRRVALSRH